MNSAKYILRAPRVFYLFNKFRLDFWQLLQQNSWYFGFSPWYMLLKNLQHHSKLSNKPMKLNSAKYKMRAPRISYLSNKYRFDFWQLLHPYSWFFWGFHLDLCYIETPSITSICQITNEVEFSKIHNVRPKNFLLIQ